MKNCLLLKVFIPLKPTVIFSRSLRSRGNPCCPTAALLLLCLKQHAWAAPAQLSQRSLDASMWRHPGHQTGPVGKTGHPIKESAWRSLYLRIVGLWQELVKLLLVNASWEWLNGRAQELLTHFLAVFAKKSIFDFFNLQDLSCKLAPKFVSVCLNSQPVLEQAACSSFSALAFLSSLFFFCSLCIFFFFSFSFSLLSLFGFVFMVFLSFGFSFLQKKKKSKKKELAGSNVVLLFQTRLATQGHSSVPIATSCTFSFFNC